MSEFATRHPIARKFFKYEEVRCQENSHKSISVIACAKMRINTLFDYSSNSTQAHVMGFTQYHFLQNDYFYAVNQLEKYLFCPIFAPSF